MKWSMFSLNRWLLPLRLFHVEGGAWVDVTNLTASDLGNNIICGNVSQATRTSATRSSRGFDA